MARLSLVWVTLSMLSGCLVDDPPPYVAPRRTAPRLDTANALPPLNQIIVKNSGELVEFSVPVTSEDAGEDLEGIFLFDYYGDGTVADPLRSPRLPASTLDDPNPRVFTLPWTVRAGLKPGCHSITLRVTHFSNLIPNRSPEVFDKKDKDEVYWFANFNVSPENANSLMDCP